MKTDRSLLNTMPNCHLSSTVKNSFRGTRSVYCLTSDRVRFPLTKKAADVVKVTDTNTSGRKKTIRLVDENALEATELSSSSDSTIPLSATSASRIRLSYTPTPTAIPLRFRRYEGKFDNQRGQSLQYFSLFPPEKEPLRGVVLYVHGSSSHCRRHISLYRELCTNGFGVISYDMVNHGDSDFDKHKTRAHISKFQHLVDDTNTFISYAKRSIYSDALRYWRKHHYSRHSQVDMASLIALPEPPLIILGSSLGSLVGIHTMLTGRHKFHASVWAAPTVGVTWNPLLYVESLLPLARFIPKARIVPAVNYDLFCQDPMFLEAFKKDPLTCTDKMTARSGAEALNAIKRLGKDKRVLEPDSTFCTIPVLFIAGSNDGVSDQQAAIRFFASLGTSDKEFKLINEGFHFVFEDTHKEAAIEHLMQWLHRRFPIETRTNEF